MDQKLLFLINHEWTRPALDSFMAALSSFAAWIPLLALLAVAVLVRGGFKARATLLVLALVVGMNDGVVSQFIKKTVNRPRPRQAQPGVRVLELQKASPPFMAFLSVFKPVRVGVSLAENGEIQGRSFPSAHTLNNFSAATVLAFFYRRRGALYFIPAALVGYSRIYVGAHWPSDVLVSIFVAVGATLLELALLEWAWQKYGAQFAPQIHARHPSLAEGAPA
jgi:undecaprenyl-diphosphatase